MLITLNYLRGPIIVTLNGFIAKKNTRELALDSICKRIIENHKGSITATGKLGKGARFDIYIPVSN